jgi:hypothetical protein
VLRTKRGLERLIAHLFGRVSSAPTKLICLIMSGGELFCTLRPCQMPLFIGRNYFVHSELTHCWDFFILLVHCSSFMQINTHSFWMIACFSSRKQFFLRWTAHVFFHMILLLLFFFLNSVKSSLITFFLRVAYYLLYYLQY